MKRTDITNLFPDATDEQVKALMDINGSDINAIRKQLEAAQASVTELKAAAETNGTAAEDLQKALEKSNELQTELDALKAADALRTMREKVSLETKVPVRMLTMETEEECRAQAKTILDFAKYPTLHDGGEPGGTPKPTTREQFAEWFNEVANK